jgi:hypothetical protein
LEGLKMIYTVFAEKDDLTFIMEETEKDGKTIVKVIGFYYGEPNEELTEEYTGKLVAELEG